MKKIIISLFVLIIGFSAYAQNRDLIFEETFDNATVLPSGWFKMGVGLFNWSVSETNNAGGNPNEVHLNWEPEFNGITRLVSPAINLTGVSSIGIQFNHNLFLFGNNVRLGIATSSDNGATWHEGWSHVYNENTGVVFISESIATQDVGSAQFRFCIFVEANSFDFDDWWFDNIRVFNMVSTDAGIMDIIGDNLRIAGAQEVSCLVANTGAEALNSIELNYQFDNGEIFTETFDVDLPSFGDTVLSFQEKAIIHEGAHNLKIWISKVNGFVDGSTNNNTLTKAINVTLGFAQRNPMIELFSASTCAPCAGINQTILELLAQNEGHYAMTKYQMNWPGTGDPYYTPECGTRGVYYNVTGVPDAYIDGTEFYPYTQEEFNLSANKKSYVEIKGTFNMNGKNINASVDVMSYGKVTNASLFVAVNEKTTYGNVGTNGETEFHHILMKFLPNAQGTIINLNPGEHKHFEFEANLSSSHIEEFTDLEVSAFVQESSTKYVYNSNFLYEYNDIHPYAPSSLTLKDNQNHTLTATWTAPEHNNQIGYNVYINGNLVLENTNATTYTANAPGGLYIVEVSAIYPNSHTSVRLAKSILIPEFISISEVEVPTILVYPNPANNIVNIEGSDIQKIDIYNILGQPIATKSVNVNEKSSIRIETNSFENGVYIIQMTTNKGAVVTKRFIISR